MQNGIWAEEEGQDTEYKKYLLPTVYDREHIECCFDTSLANDLFWQHYLRKNNLPALTIFYEDLDAHYFEKMNEIYCYLGITTHEVFNPQLHKQANRQSGDWETRFIEETPWMHDPAIASAYEEGDLEALYLLRCRAVIFARESSIWCAMPVNRYKKFRQFYYRVRRKLT